MRHDRTSAPPPVVPDPVDGLPAARGWAGWVVFAGMLLILLGAFHVLEGIAVLAGARPDDLPPGGAATWGWGAVALGVVAAGIGLGLLAGSPTARVLGVLIAGLSAVGELLISPAFTAGSVVVVAVDVLCIYAITVHGGELRAPSVR